MPSIEGHTIEHSIGELQKFVKRKTAPRRYTDTGPSVDPEAYLRDIAITNGGIVNISSVTAGKGKQESGLGEFIPYQFNGHLSLSLVWISPICRLYVETPGGPIQSSV